MGGFYITERIDIQPHTDTLFSSSVGATARCGLWPVEQYLCIFPYPSPTLSIFSLPALENLFLRSTYTQYFKSWKSPCNYQNIYLVLFRPSLLNLSNLFLCSTFVTIIFLLCGVVNPTPNPQPGWPGYPFLSGSSPLTYLAWEALAVAYATASIALRFMWPHKPHHYVKVGTPSGRHSL